MDPAVCVYDLLDAMSRNDREAVEDHLDDLRQWNRAGGFLPQFHRMKYDGSPFHVERQPAHILAKETR